MVAMTYLDMLLGAFLALTFAFIGLLAGVLVGYAIASDEYRSLRNRISWLSEPKKRFHHQP